MESTQRNSFTGSGTILSKWHPTVTTRTPGRSPTTHILLPTARSRSTARTKHTVCGKRERHSSNRQRGRRGRASADNRCAYSPDTRSAGAHVRCGSLGPARLTRGDKKPGSGPNTIIRRHRPRYDGTGHAAAGVRVTSSPCPSSLSGEPRRNLYSTFITPWADSSAAHTVEPDFHLPGCYNVQPPAPGPGKAAAFSDETLFFMFYSSPRDALQEIAAQEL